MKLFEFAIASIVDANTGNGLVHGGGQIAYREQQGRARAIRSQSIHDLLGAVGGKFRGLYADYRERVRQRRALEELSHLSDHYLEDIGLTRGDLAAVKLGQISLEALNDDRRSRLAVTPLDYVETRKVDSLSAAADAANEADYSGAKCA